MKEQIIEWILGCMCRLIALKCEEILVLSFNLRNEQICMEITVSIVCFSFLLLLVVDRYTHLDKMSGWDDYFFLISTILTSFLTYVFLLFLFSSVLSFSLLTTKQRVSPPFCLFAVRSNQYKKAANQLLNCLTWYLNCTWQVSASLRGDCCKVF